MSSPARPATSTIAPAATGPSAAPAASTIAPAAAGPSAAPAAISAMRTIAVRPVAASHMRRAVAVEVRLALSFVGKIAAAFNHHRARRRRNRSKLALSPSRHRRAFRSAPPPIFARCSFRIALRDSRMRLPSTASTFTST